MKYKDDDVKGELCMRGWVLQHTAQPVQAHAPSVSAACENTESRVPGEIQYKKCSDDISTQNKGKQRNMI